MTDAETMTQCTREGRGSKEVSGLAIEPKAGVRCRAGSKSGLLKGRYRLAGFDVFG